MPYFRFTASTPYCGEELIEYYEIPEDELASVDEIAEQLGHDVAEMFWDGEEETEDGDFSDGCYTQEEFYAESSCYYDEISKEEFDENR